MNNEIVSGCLCFFVGNIAQSFKDAANGVSGFEASQCTAIKKVAEPGGVFFDGGYEIHASKISPAWKVQFTRDGREGYVSEHQLRRIDGHETEQVEDLEEVEA